MIAAILRAQVTMSPAISSHKYPYYAIARIGIAAFCVAVVADHADISSPRTTLDSLFNLTETFQALVDTINGFTGLNLTGDDVTELGKQVLKVEREFNKAAGFTSKDDRLPAYFQKEALTPHGVTFGVKDEDLDQVFNF